MVEASIVLVFLWVKYKCVVYLYRSSLRHWGLLWVFHGGLIIFYKKSRKSVLKVLSV